MFKNISNGFKTIFICLVIFWNSTPSLQSEMKIKGFSVIVAAGENMGIGLKGKLPWRLRNEGQYFQNTTTKTVDPIKKNVVVMGRKTYFGMSEKHRPLRGRINVVLTLNPSNYTFPDGVVVCSSLSDALKRLSEPDLYEKIENIWICGGYSLYKEAMESPLCRRIYFTQVRASFESDAFFPTIDKTIYERIENDLGTPTEDQEENGITYQYQTYQRIQNFE